MLLKQNGAARTAPGGRAFSTLYRVDAIEATNRLWVEVRNNSFQYPLSGRCY